MADMVTKVDASILNQSMDSINKNTVVLSENLKSIKEQANHIMDVYRTNGKSTESIEKLVTEIDEIEKNYLSSNHEFNSAMNSMISTYSATDAQIQAQAMGNNTSGSGFVGSGSGVVAGNVGSSTSGPSVNQGSGVVTPDGKVIEKPGYVPNGATLTADGRWSTVNQDGKGTIYTSKGIEGTPIETDDVRIKALASGMSGGQVVKMADGRIAVKDQYGGGTIFNADGSTEDVAGRTIMAGKVGQISSSGNGADPFTQDVASEMINSDLNSRQTNRLIKGYESQQEAEGTNSVLSVDTEALRDQLDAYKEGGADMGVQNFGPGFSNEHNAQVIADQAVKQATDNIVNNVSGVVQNNGSSLLGGALGGAAPLVGNTAQSAFIGDANPPVASDPAIEVTPIPQAGVPNDIPAVPEVPPIPEPGQPIGFDAPGTPGEPSKLPF